MALNRGFLLGLCIICRCKNHSKKLQAIPTIGMVSHSHHNIYSMLAIKIEKSPMPML